VALKTDRPLSHSAVLSLPRNVVFFSSSSPCGGSCCPCVRYATLISLLLYTVCTKCQVHNNTYQPFPIHCLSVCVFLFLLFCLVCAIRRALSFAFTPSLALCRFLRVSLKIKREGKRPCKTVVFVPLFCLFLHTSSSLFPLRQFQSVRGHTSVMNNRDERKGDDRF
jgi:hypothetical protein